MTRTSPHLCQRQVLCIGDPIYEVAVEIKVGAAMIGRAGMGGGVRGNGRGREGDLLSIYFRLASSGHVRATKAKGGNLKVQAK